MKKFYLMELCENRVKELDSLAKLGTLLGIYDTKTLLDIDEFMRTTLPINLPNNTNGIIAKIKKI